MVAPGDAEHHRRFDGMAVEHVLGGLDDVEGRLFRAHLLECGHCRARVGELRAIAHELADVERDEERMRDTKRLETKRREEGAERPAAGSRAPRQPRGQAAIIFLLVALILLGIWNFFLRATVTDLEGQVESALEANRTLEAGRAWDVENPGDLDVEVREDGAALVVVVDGLEDAAYRLEVVDAEGEVVGTQEARPSDGHLFALVREVDPEAETLFLRPGSNGAEEPLVEAHADR